MVACLLLATLSGCKKDSGPTDEELIEQFIEDVTGPVDDALVARALGYLALDKLPIDVRVPHMAGVYAADRDGTELVAAFKRGMRERFYGTELAVRSQKIEIKDGRAEITLALMTGLGPVRATLNLQRLPEGFRLSLVHVDR